MVLLMTTQPTKGHTGMTTCILPVVLVLTAFFVPDFAPGYYGSADVCVMGLLLTKQDFFSRQ
jgi:hypothetical protein